MPNATHICAFFDSSTQELDCLVPYFSEGLDQGEQVLTIRDEAALEAHSNDLQARMNRPLDEAMRSNQFRVLASEETYLKEGHFGAERMGHMLEINKFSGKAVMDVLATHRIVLMGERIYENPYYVEPEAFLQRLLRRGSAPLRREETEAA